MGLLDRMQQRHHWAMKPIISIAYAAQERFVAALTKAHVQRSAPLASLRARRGQNSK